MTDEEVRGRLDRLERGDPVSATLHTLMGLQFAAVFLLAGPLTDFFAWTAYSMLLVLCVTWMVGVLLRRRAGRAAPEVVRGRYETRLSAAIEKARKRRDHVWWQGAVAVVIGALALLFAQGRHRDAWIVIALMLLLAALDAYQQWRWVLPRLQREQGAYRDMLIRLESTLPG